VESEPLLQERNFGDLRGTPYDELEEDLFGQGFAPPGGETWEEFHRRVDRAWERVCAAAQGLDGHLAVVTHGLVLHSLAERHLSLPPDARAAEKGLPPRPIGNTSLTVVEPSGCAGESSPGRVTLFGCTRHLGAGPNEGKGAITGI
jgi:broad specificity phosphatase PhoE